MTERAALLIDLHQELVGPRGGFSEAMPSPYSPRDEYMCGVLEPVRAAEERADAPLTDDLPTDDVESGSSEEDDAAVSITSTPSFGLAPALDPKSLPRSIGISFFVEAEDGVAPHASICACWARYLLDSSSNSWVRFASSHVELTSLLVDNRTIPCADGVSIHIRVRRAQPIGWRVSIYLINTILPADPKWISVSELVFQPQIRVVCENGTRVVPVSDALSVLSVVSGETSEARADAGLNLQYKHRRAMARGHLCGATWREIDSQRPHASITSPQFEPFSWGDRMAVNPSLQAKFELPDVRTELLPMYAVPAPEMNWPATVSPEPMLDASSLAETWRPADMRAALSPLADAYEQWIVQRRADAAALDQVERLAAHQNIEGCEAALERIRAGIDALVLNDEARLAFCFANKSIALQALWRGQQLVWRPFQLAFLLLNVDAITRSTSPDRRICDLLWFATGGGKTEAYLGLTAFTLAYRRRRARGGDGEYPGEGGGVAVLSRYTLRLLTIQQFRRAMGLITACEMLRVQGLSNPNEEVGWRPALSNVAGTFIWGGTRFSAGLWVGGGVTPNRLQSIPPMPPPGGGRWTFLAGALDILQGAGPSYQGPNTRLAQYLQRGALEREGEPAQITNCPCCHSLLAISDATDESGLGPGRHHLHYIFSATNPVTLLLVAAQAAQLPVVVNSASTSACNSTTHVLTLDFTISPTSGVSPRQLENWWYQFIRPAISGDARLLCASPLRPGYFVTTYDNTENFSHQSDFEIYCPSPNCQLNQSAWAEQVPLAKNGLAPTNGAGAISCGLPAGQTNAALPTESGRSWQHVFPAFRAHGAKLISSRIPISAFTVDDQIYHRCPSLVVATVDKFARLAFEAKAASLFGNVDHYHSRSGYYREGAPPLSTGGLALRFNSHPSGGPGGKPLHVVASGFRPPDLIIQDELHLIEGPLGSMVGLYETAVDQLCEAFSAGRPYRPKYVASSATVREAASQVQSLFDRTLALFPPSAISSDDRFFSREVEVHPLDENRAGRLYVGVAAPGRGAQTPIVRIWSSLLQSAWNQWSISATAKTDQYFTLVGYFNAIRELAGARSLYGQDIKERLSVRWGQSARPLEDGLELSGRTPSLDLPAKLAALEKPSPDSPDAAFSTSMFGTGVDVNRLGLMVVHGQPKTTASYIQATGRVGRLLGGLVVSFLRASRPRDLDHYEFFSGYHRALGRYVEPVSVSPYSPFARDRGLGPLSVILLRLARTLGSVPVAPEWKIQERLSGSYYSQAGRMASCRYHPEVQAIPMVVETRSQAQSLGRRPPAGAASSEVSSQLDRWRLVAAPHTDPDRFVYFEPGFLRVPQREVVLGDAQHTAQGLAQVFLQTPQSLREVEDTTGFQTK